MIDDAGIQPPVRVALLGCGAVSQMYYAPALKTLERAGQLTLNCVYDPDVRAAERIIRVFPNTRRAASLKHLHDTELVIVASPPQFHAEQTIYSLEANMAVLSEKPLALSVEDAESVIACAASKRHLLAIGLVRRFLPAAQLIRNIVSEKFLGEVQCVSCFEGGPFRWPALSTSFFDKSTGGGVFGDIGPHIVDLLIWWFGHPVKYSYEDDAIDGVEANCRFSLQFDSGCIVTARLSRDWALPNRYFFECANGWLSWSVPEPEAVEIGFKGSRFVLKGTLHDDKVEYGTPAAGPRRLGFEQSFTEQLRNVVAAVRGRERLFVPAVEALSALRVMECCYRARRRMRMDWMTSAELEPSARSHT